MQHAPTQAAIVQKKRRSGNEGGPPIVSTNKAHTDKRLSILGVHRLAAFPIRQSGAPNGRRMSCSFFGPGRPIVTKKQENAPSLVGA